MSVDLATVKRVASLARIAVSEEEAERMVGELNGILGFVEQLSEVDVNGVEPMTSVTPMVMRKRTDVVTDGDKADDIVAVKQVTHICMTGTDGILKQFAHFVCRFNAAANKRRIFGLNTACGDKADDIVANAPATDRNFFLVPKVVE